MTDPLRRVTSGTDWQPSAAQINLWNDAARAHSEQTSRKFQQTQRLPSNIVLVKNDSGEDINRHGLLGLTGPMTEPSLSLESFLRQGTYRAGAVTAGAVVVIAIEPIPAGRVGRCLAPGLIVQAKIDLPDGQTYGIARPLDHEMFEARLPDEFDDTDFTVRVIWHEEGPGEKWAVLQMPGPGRRAAAAGGCSPCQPPAGTIEAEAVEGLLYATIYDFKPLCDRPAIRFEWSEVAAAWVPVVVEWDCGAGPIEFTFTLTVAGDAPGDAVVQGISEESHTVVWTSSTAFQPDQPLPMPLSAADQDCPCAPWDVEPCLIPVSEEAE